MFFIFALSLSQRISPQLTKANVHHLQASLKTIAHSDIKKGSAATVKDDINYDDDPLFYYEQNKSINFMKQFKSPSNVEEEEQMRQNNLNEIETTLNEESGAKKQAYSHLDNLHFEDFNQDEEEDGDEFVNGLDEDGNEEINDDYNRDDYADADEDELGYFNIHK